MNRLIYILCMAILAGLAYFYMLFSESPVVGESVPLAEFLVEWDTTPASTIEAKYKAGDNFIIINYLIKETVDALPVCKEYAVTDEYMLFSTEHTTYQVYRDQLTWHIEDANGVKCQVFDGQKSICEEWDGR